MLELCNIWSRKVVILCEKLRMVFLKDSLLCFMDIIIFLVSLLRGMLGYLNRLYAYHMTHAPQNPPGSLICLCVYCSDISNNWKPTNGRYSDGGIYVMLLSSLNLSVRRESRRVGL